MAAIEKKLKKRHSALPSAVRTTGLLARSTTMNNMTIANDEMPRITGEQAVGATCDEATLEAEAETEKGKVDFKSISDVDFEAMPQSTSAEGSLQDLEDSLPESSATDLNQAQLEEPADDEEEEEDDSFMKQVKLCRLQEDQVREPAEAESVDKNTATDSEEIVNESNTTGKQTTNMPQEQEPQAERTGRCEAVLLKAKLLCKKLVDRRQCGKVKGVAEAPTTKDETFEDQTPTVKQIGATPDSSDASDFISVAGEVRASSEESDPKLSLPEEPLLRTVAKRAVPKSIAIDRLKLLRTRECQGA